MARLSRTPFAVFALAALSATAMAAPPVDLQGDPLPEGAVARWGTIRLRQGAAIGALAFSPDGKTIASGAYDDEVYLWDADSGRARRRLAGHTDAVRALAFAPDGKRVASSSDDKTVRVWDADSGKELRRLEGHTQGVLALAFAPDGKTLASAGSDYVVRIWDLQTGKERHRLEGHDSGVNAVAFSPDGKVLASAGDDDTVRLWDTATGKPLRKLTGHDGLVLAVAISPDGKMVASGGKDGTLRLWHAASGTELRKVAAHDDGVSAVAFAADGKSLTTAGKDAKVVRWDVATGKELGRLDRQHDDLTAATLSADGTRAAFGGEGGLIGLWDALTGKELAPHSGARGPVEALAFSPDGKALALADPGADVLLLDPATAKEVRRIKAGHARRLLFASEGGNLAVSAIALGRDSRVSLWDVRADKPLHELTAFGTVRPSEHRDTSAAFSADGKLAFGLVSEREVRAWETATGKKTTVLSIEVEDQPPLCCFAVSPDGGTLAVAYRDKQVRLWDVRSGQMLRACDAAEEGIRRLEFSPDGRVIAAGGDGNVVKLWEVLTAGQIASFAGHDAPITALAWSADARTLASGSADRTVRLWDLPSGRETQHLSGHQGGIRSLAFAPDGRRLASGSEDGTALVWDTVPAAPARARERREKEVEAFWADLGGDDAAKAWAAMWTLARAPKQSVPLVAKHVRPVPAFDEKRLAKLFADLDDDSFDVREKATAELKRAAESIEGTVQKELTRTKSEEVRQRLGRVLEEVDQKGQGARRRAVPSRALAVLEHAGTPEARQALEKIAEGAPGAWLTREAKAALARARTER